MGKTNRSRCQALARNRGLTLIELMVSLVIGLLLAIVASSSYLYSKQAYNAVSENSQLEENGRFALNLLTKNIQSAGYVAIPPNFTAVQKASDIKVSGCDFGMTAAQTASSQADFACRASTPAGTSRSASINVFYETDPPGAGLAGVDCLGNDAVAVVGTKFEVRAKFFISTSTVQTANGTTTMGQLSCATDPTGGTGAFASQPLIPGVHQLGVNYLTPSATLQADGKPSKTAQKSNTAAQLELANEWNKVTGVELCVLTKSIQASGNDTGTLVTDCFGNQFTPSASETYRRFTTIVSLRNRT
jgi:type IV pilus assembly protein PilW